jgi:hypothetical protein
VFTVTEKESRALQGKNITAEDSRQASDACKRFLESYRTAEMFTTCYADIVKSSEDLTDPPALPRYKRDPKRIDKGAENHRHDDIQQY